MADYDWWERGQWVDYFNARANPEIDPPNGGDDGRGNGGDGDEEAPILGLHEGPKPPDGLYQAAKQAARLETARSRFEAEQAQREAEQAEDLEIEESGLEGPPDDGRDDDDRDGGPDNDGPDYDGPDHDGPGPDDRGDGDLGDDFDDRGG